MNPQSTDGQLDVLQLIPGKQGLVASGTATFPGVDLKGFVGEVKLILTSQSPVADGSTTLTIDLLESSDNSSFATWAARPTFAPVTGTQGLVEVSLDTRTTKQYVQARHTIVGTTATFAHALIGVGTKQHN
jgi:hypothetical protein